MFSFPHAHVTCHWTRLSISGTSEDHVCISWTFNQAATKPYELRGFDGDEDLSRGLLGCDIIYWCGKIPSLRRVMLPSASIHPEDGCSMTLRNVGILLHNYTVSQPRRPRLKIWLRFTAPYRRTRKSVSYAHQSSMTEISNEQEVAGLISKKCRNSSVSTVPRLRAGLSRFYSR